MQKKISGLVVALGAVLLPLSVAHAAEVTHIYTNNLFATVSTDDGNGNSMSLSVTREKGKGAFVDTIAIFVSGSDGSFGFIQGTLPKGALQITAKKASVDVDLSQITVTGGFNLPAAGAVHVNWTATDVTRTSGSTKFQSGNLTANIVGTSTFAIATASGSVLGNALVNPSAFLNVAHESVILHFSTN